MNVLNQYIGKDYALYHGDSVEVLQGLPANSIDHHLQVYTLFPTPTEIWEIVQKMNNSINNLNF